MARSIPCGGIYQEIVPPERLVFINNAVDADDNVIIAGLTTVTFADEGGKTKLTMNIAARQWWTTPRSTWKAWKWAGA